MKNLLVVMWVVASWPGVARGASRFGEAGTIVLGGHATVDSSSTTDTTSGVWFDTQDAGGHRTYGDLVTETSATGLMAGPDLTYFLANHWAVRVGATLERVSTEISVTSPTESTKISSLALSFGGTLGLDYYIQAMDKGTWAFVGGEVGIRRGREETESPYGEADNGLPSKSIGGHVGLAFPVGSSGVFAVLARIRRTYGEIDRDHPALDSETEDTAFGIGTRLGLVF